MYNSTHLKKLGVTKVSWVLPLVKLLVDWRLSDLPGLIPFRDLLMGRFEMEERVFTSDIQMDERTDTNFQQEHIPQTSRQKLKL